MRPTDRYQWILEYLRKWQEFYGTSSYSVDILNADFVTDYVEATGTKRYSIMPYGADKCSQLGEDLSAMYRKGLLDRSTVGIDGMSGMGFPRWVYSYSLKKEATNEGKAANCPAPKARS